MTSTGADRGWAASGCGRLGRPRRTGAAVLAIGLGLAAVSACSSPPNTAGPAPAKTNPTPNGSGSAGSAGSAGSGTKSSATGKSVGVREVDAYRFDVKSAEVLAGDKALLPPGPGTSLVGINMEMTNISSTSQPVSTFAQLSLKTPSGPNAVEVPPADGVHAFKDGNLAPGASVDGYILYEVPDDQLSKLTLEMVGDLSGTNATIDLQLKPR